MRIDFLADHPEFIEALAPPIFEHWRFALPEDTLADRVAKLRSHVNRTALPIAWVAHLDGEVVGTAALRIHDLEGREDLTPWLGGVFVLPAYRGRGIGSELCMRAEGHAWNTGIRQLYLFTLDHHSMYARLGWKQYCPATWRGHASDIMVKQRDTV